MAQYNLGAMYATGEGVNQDYNEAVEWFRKAAAHGHAAAQYNLGVMYDDGTGVVQDRKEAAQWYQLAAVQDHADAQHNLDIMQRDNKIPTPPPGTAVTAILLTSSQAAKLNNKTGTVVEAQVGRHG